VDVVWISCFPYWSRRAKSHRRFRLPGLRARLARLRRWRSVAWSSIRSTFRPKRSGGISNNQSTIIRMSALNHAMDQWWLFHWDLKDARDRVRRGLVLRSVGVRTLASHRFQYLHGFYWQSGWRKTRPLALNPQAYHSTSCTFPSSFDRVRWVNAFKSDSCRLGK
jgi:hypothetical protein